MQERKNCKYNNPLTQADKDRVLELYSQGLTNTEISKIVPRTPTTIKNILKKQGLKSNIKRPDRSRPCKICGKIFTPKCHDGVKKDKYTTCSTECGKESIRQANTIYNDYNIKQVIKLKRQHYTNGEISNKIGVDINKIKEIVKENNLYLDPKIAQANAYRKKIEKNPNGTHEF